MGPDRRPEDVDAEVELGVVIGEPAWRVAVEAAARKILGYTIVNDVSSRDAWLDGDQWLLGKSMPGFCPVGPWVVTADDFDPTDVRLGCTINGEAIQDGRTADMRFSNRGGDRVPQQPRPTGAGRPDPRPARRRGSRHRPALVAISSRATR